jgi:hypothetical protein
MYYIFGFLLSVEFHYGCHYFHVKVSGMSSSQRAWWQLATMYNDTLLHVSTTNITPCHTP